MGSVESFLAGSARSKAQFIGERTIAARVLKDAYRSAAQTSGGGTTNGRRASRRRDLRLEVIWSTVSTKEAVAHVLTKGHSSSANRRASSSSRHSACSGTRKHAASAQGPSFTHSVACALPNK